MVRIIKKTVSNERSYLLITPSKVSSGQISGWIQVETSSLETKDPGLRVLLIDLTFQVSLMFSFIFFGDFCKVTLTHSNNGKVRVMRFLN